MFTGEREREIRLPPPLLEWRKLIYFVCAGKGEVIFGEDYTHKEALDLVCPCCYLASQPISACNQCIILSPTRSFLSHFFVVCCHMCHENTSPLVYSGALPSPFPSFGDLLFSSRTPAPPPPPPQSCFLIIKHLLGKRYVKRTQINYTSFRCLFIFPF